MDSTAELPAAQRVAHLEPSVLRLEQALEATGRALCHNDPAALESAAAALHKALQQAVADFRRAAIHGTVAPSLRLRLVAASGQVAAVRQAVARATASLDRAIDVLIPEHPPTSVYDASGVQPRSARGGVLA
jgi:hypothetical protein